MIEETLRRLGAIDDVDQMLAEFLVYHEANIARESRPFPGAAAAVERLASQGATLAVCTNKPEYLSRLLLQELDLEHYFSAIAGRDTFAVSKPDPGHLTSAIGIGAEHPFRALMVGLGFGHAAMPPASLEAEAMTDHFDQLEVCAATLLAAKRRCRAQS
jgi:phosphoglycolate phosphatase